MSSINIEGASEIITGDVWGATVEKNWRGLQLHLSRDGGHPLIITIEGNNVDRLAQELHDELNAIYGFDDKYGDN